MPGEGSATARGYDYRHRKLREALLAELRADPEEQLCPRCGEPMLPEQELDLGHTDDRSGYNGLEHMSCNRHAGAVRGNAMRVVNAGTGRW